MTERQNFLGSRLAKSWSRVTAFLNALDPDHYDYPRDGNSRLRNEIAELGFRVKRLESFMAENS